MSFLNDIYEFLIKTDVNTGKKRYQVLLNSEWVKSIIKKGTDYIKNNTRQALAYFAVLFLLFFFIASFVQNHVYVIKRYEFWYTKAKKQVTNLFDEDIAIADQEVKNFNTKAKYSNYIEAWTSFQVKYENASLIEIFITSKDKNIEIIYNSFNEKVYHKQVEEKMVLIDQEDCKVFRDFLTYNKEYDNINMEVFNYNLSDQQQCSFITGFIKKTKTDNSHYMIILLYKSKNNINSILYGAIATFKNKENKELFVTEIKGKIGNVFDVVGI